MTSCKVAVLKHDDKGISLNYSWDEDQYLSHVNMVHMELMVGALVLRLQLSCCRVWHTHSPFLICKKSRRLPLTLLPCSYSAPAVQHLSLKPGFPKVLAKVSYITASRARWSEKQSRIFCPACNLKCLYATGGNINIALKDQLAFWVNELFLAFQGSNFSSNPLLASFMLFRFYHWSSHFFASLLWE